jgi:type II secretory pathway pseudopilin PulG
MIELLVVMVIVAMMALVATPWFLRITQRNKLKSAANEIHSTLLAARMLAVKRNQPVYMEVTAALATDSMHLVEIVEPAPGPLTRRIQIAGKTLTFVALPVGVPPNRVTFGGDGRMTVPALGPALIVVEGPVGVASPNQITVQTENNGRVRVITPVAWN